MSGGWTFCPSERYVYPSRAESSWTGIRTTHLPHVRGRCPVSRPRGRATYVPQGKERRGFRGVLVDDHGQHRRLAARDRSAGGSGSSRGRKGGQGRDRTGDLPLFRRTLVPTELPGRPPRRRTSWRGKPYRSRCPLPELADAGHEDDGTPVAAQQNASPEDSGEACDATPTGLEPATSAVTGRRANQLRYGARCVAVLRFRPPTLAHEAPPTGFEPVLPP